LAVVPEPNPRPNPTERADALGVELAFGGVELVGELEPLWLAMFDHHTAVRASAVPVVDRELSWPRRRALYQRILVAADAFVVIARRDGRPVGYVVAHVHDDGPDDTWPTGARIGEIESLAVLPEERGAGLGTLLLDVAEALLATAGAHDIRLFVLAGNDAAQRFYERRGMSPVLVGMLRLGSSAGQSGQNGDG
jgi:ribosomal protein S18 acetylase RimI-like enzyme